MAKKEFPLKAFVNVLLVVAIVAVLATEITGFAAAGKADLVVTGITVAPVNPVSFKGSLLENVPAPAKITVDIKNQGAADSAATELDLEVYGNEGVTKYRISIGEIPAEKSVSVTKNHYFENSGSVPIEASIDTLFNKVAESNEENNYYMAHVEVI